MLRFQVIKRFAGTAAAKEGKDISAVFPSLRGEIVGPLKDQHFVNVQKRLLNGREKEIRESWDRLIPAVQAEVENIRKHGNKVIPDVDFKDLHQRPDGTVEFPPEVRAEIRERGTVVVRNVIPRDQARQYKYDLDEYIEKNPAHGFPLDQPTVYELYWTKQQLAGRGHENSIKTQMALTNLWHSTSKQPQPISSRHPVTYADRLRIRQPGDAKFMLGPHIDGGGIERWEDVEYSNVYKKIFDGKWEEFDSFDFNHRLTANSRLHECEGQCSMFRAFQGWLSMSETSPGEGTLQVNPMLKLATSYLMLRPFFAPETALGKPGEDYNPNDGNLSVPWHFTGATSCYPNSMPGSGQELNKDTHPHLHLDDTMVSIPKMYPGDFVAWHCDSIHAVESVHRGAGDSSVMYVPACPLTDKNLDYLYKLRAAFMRKSPAPDYPDADGPGEAGFDGVGMPDDITSKLGRQAMGLEPFDVASANNESERIIMEQANKMLF